MAGNVPKIVVIGPGYVDMVVRCAEFPVAGQTVSGTGFSCSSTGSGPNQAVEAALCGCEVSLVGKVGGDEAASVIRKTLTEYGVSDEYIFAAEAKNTGAVMTFVNAEGENASCMFEGANSALTEQDISNAEQVIAEADVCLINGRLPQETVLTAVRTATIQGTKSILDPAKPIDHGRSARGLPIEYFNAEVMIPNLYEAAQIAERSAANYHDAKLIGSDIIARGTKHAVITMGKRGCMVVNREGMFQVPAFEIELVDHTGTGDAFAGALAACYATTSDICEAVKFASAAGALACTKFGSIEAMPAKSEILELLQKDDTL